MITQDQGQLILENIIERGESSYHPYYKQVVQEAEDAQKYVSRKTEKQKDWLKNYTLRESKNQKEQRIRLTNTVTSVALAPLFDYFQEVQRTDGIKKNISTPSDNTKDKLQKHFTKFLSEDSLHDYCFKTAFHYSKVDPNAWTVFEQIRGKNEAGGELITDIYPLEILSSEAVDFKTDKTGTLQYLAIKFEEDHKAKNGNKKIKRFYLYGIGYVWEYIQIDPDVEFSRDYASEGYEEKKIDNSSYWCKGFQNFTTEVPAIRWSAYLCDETHGKTGETLFAEAYPILQDLIRDKSFYDLQKTIHVRPQRHRYAKRCTHRDEVSGYFCDNGYMYNSEREKGDMCPKCNGSGKQSLGGEQDEITLEYMEGMTKDNLVSLAELTHYVQPPIEIAEHYRKDIQYYQAMVMLTVFSQQAVSAEQLATVQTATQAGLEASKINNKLHPFGELISRAWEKAWRIGLQYYKTQGEVDMSYPPDFKLKTVLQLIGEYQAAQTAGLPVNVLDSIVYDILRKQHRNAPKQVAEIIAFDKYKPWKSKTPEERALIIQELDKETDPDYILWFQWDKTLNEIQSSGLDFVALDPEARKNTLYLTSSTLHEETKLKPAPSVSFGDPLGINTIDDEDIPD